MAEPPTTSTSDLVEVVMQARAGDPTAFEELVNRTEKLLKKLAYPIVGENLMQDALQETYLLAFRNIGRLREAGSFIPWLSRTCLHVCYQLRKQGQPAEQLEHRQVSPDQSGAVVARVTLQQALNRLQRADRDLLILREMLGFSYEELAYTLRLNVGTVKSRLSAARKRLKERLHPQEA